MPSGKLDQGEPLTAGAARELFEETDVQVEPEHLKLRHVVHHRQEDGSERIGFFFEATQWKGTPTNKEPEKCLTLQWFTDHDLPEDIIEYPGAGLFGCLGRTGVLTQYGW
ncbi:NUDIX domain-containing protein [Streptomyces sp. NPDC096032]|uniref:NUDIX domain-containing protein n=1 Tax=Streptomyces sp. NPDC096032 TaxID=3366070 RepID=UPI0037F2F65C